MSPNYFLFRVNPDGYVFNEEIEPNGGGMWRKTKGMDMEWIIIEIIHLLMKTVMKYGIQVAHQIMLIVIPMQVMAHSLRLKIEQLDILLNLIILRLHLIIIHMGI